ncbi:MAG: TCP-1/cpn60 chaperonin family protein, partial [Solirubrobacterales bacterium]
LRQFAENSGLEGSVVVADVGTAKQRDGLYAATAGIVDLVEAGVIDPAMVTRSALQNAASIAKNILTTEAIIADAPEDAPAGMPGGMPYMGGMM